MPPGPPRYRHTPVQPPHPLSLAKLRATDQAARIRCVVRKATTGRSLGPSSIVADVTGDCGGPAWQVLAARRVVCDAIVRARIAWRQIVGGTFPLALLDTSLGLLRVAFELRLASDVAHATPVPDGVATRSGVDQLLHALSANAMHDGAQDVPVGRVLGDIVPTTPVLVELLVLLKVFLVASALEIAGLNPGDCVICQALQHGPALQPIALAA
mmetsp:Transcript_15213/g.31900  ORF Transcript_15213/g.31900 Transcript_15213/m.31900 type:complete len:213 (+) Transcript_15213:680-1318(+)